MWHALAIVNFTSGRPSSICGEADSHNSMPTLGNSPSTNLMYSATFDEQNSFLYLGNSRISWATTTEEIMWKAGAGDRILYNGTGCLLLFGQQILSNNIVILWYKHQFTDSTH